MTRLEKLLVMLEQEPGDVFLRYAVAMEHRGAGDFAESERLFRGLMAGQPPYVPAYFMLGQMLAGEDEVESARTALRTGIEQARAQGNLHAAGEMSELLASLGELGEG